MMVKSPYNHWEKKNKTSPTFMRTKILREIAYITSKSTLLHAI